jgi:predicted NodU family carbamoyl transferase
MTYILGLNAYHADAAACLIKDGELVAALEEERFRRIKYWGGFPSEAIRYCLREAGISLGDVDHVAVNSDIAANRWRKLAYALTSGFPHYGDEYKVMGLAPYGQPAFVDSMKEIVRLKNDGGFALDLRYFRHATGEGANYQVTDRIPSGGRLWSDELAKLLGPARDPAAPLEDRHREHGAGHLGG